MYLRPLDQFTNRLNLFGLSIIKEHVNWCDAYDEYFDIWMSGNKNIENLVLQAPYEIFTYFLKHHYDVFGRIKKGQAIKFIYPSDFYKL